MYSLYILKCCILDIFWLQLVFFIFKLLFIITYLVSFVFMIIKGAHQVWVLITGSISIVIAVITTVIVFYYIGIVHAKRKAKLGCKFRVVMLLNYILSLLAFVGFGFIILKQVINDDLNVKFKHKAWINRGLAFSILGYYILGVSIFIFLNGLILKKIGRAHV